MRITHTAIIVLGASGDLAKKKLFPSLNHLITNQYIDLDTCRIIGNGRKKLTKTQFQEQTSCPSDTPQTHYCYFAEQTGLWKYLKEQEEHIHSEFQHFIIFFSLPANVYLSSAHSLLQDGFPSDSRTRVVIEKPFGYDAKSAKALHQSLLHYFTTDQIYLIDHYLGKESVQNILAIRFANQLLKPLWNKNYIQKIEINSFETIGIENRGKTYENMGAIRDVVQNHLLQLLALSIMEPPKTLQAEDIRQSKHELLKVTRCQKAYRFQYETYRSEPNVDPHSKVETYAELELSVQNPRWEGVPIYIRAGKKVHRSGVEIAFYLKDDNLYPNSNELIVFKVQPMPRLEFVQKTKKPGFTSGQEFVLQDIHLHYSSEYSIPKDKQGFEAYSQLLYHVLLKEKSLFVDVHEAITAWEVINNALDEGDVTFYQDNTFPVSKFPDI